MDSSLYNGGNYYEIKVPGTGIPKWFKFNHQSDGNSVSFKIGHKFPKAVVCIAFQSVEAHISGSFSVYVSVNGCKEKLLFQDIEEMSGHLWLFSVSNLKLPDSSPYEENENEIKVICEIDESNESSLPFQNIEFIKWMGVHVECMCCGVHNKRGDSRGVELRLQRRRRNRQPTHGIHHQKPYLSRFGWLRIRFRRWKRSSKLWRRSSRPTLLTAPAHDVGLPMDTTNSIPQMAHTFVNDDSDINLYPPSKKTRTS